MAIEPLGPISKIAQRLETMLAATAVWDSLAATIHHHHLPPPTNAVSHTRDELTSLRPFVLIWTNDRDGIRWTRDTAGHHAASNSDGELIVRIERNTPADMTPADAARDFENAIGRLCKGTAEQPGLIDLAGDPRYLPLVEVTLVEHSRTAPDKITAIGDAQRAFILCTWSTA